MTDLKEIAKKLGFKAMLENWDEYGKEPLVRKILEAEELDQNRRSLEKRLKASHVQELKPVSDFDWNWPKVIDRELIDELFTLKFLGEALNVVFVGPNGVGKSMLSKNLIYAALLAGKKTKFTSASQMLADLSAQDGASARKRCLLKYTSPHLLAIDELGYLSYDNRYADLLYEVLNARYLKTSTIITTNKVFQEWGEIFPNAGCVVTLVDRLIHKSEIVKIEGDSYRKKEALERAQQRAQQKRSKDKQKQGDS